MSEAEHDGSYDLAVPFVVVRTAGGEYDDQSFVAGFEAGRIDAALRAVANMNAGFDRWVYPALAPQLDLIAMQYGYVAHPCDEDHSDVDAAEWVHFIFHPGDHEVPTDG